MYEIKFRNSRTVRVSSAFAGCEPPVETKHFDYGGNTMISGPYKQGRFEDSPELKLNGRNAKIAMYARLDEQTGTFTLEKKLWVESHALSRLFGDKSKFEQVTPIEGTYTFEQAQEKLRAFKKECENDPHYLSLESDRSWINNHFLHATEVNVTEAVAKQRAEKAKRANEAARIGKLMAP